MRNIDNPSILKENNRIIWLNIDDATDRISDRSPDFIEGEAEVCRWWLRVASMVHDHPGEFEIFCQEIFKDLDNLDVT